MNSTARGVLRPFSAGFALLMRLGDALIIWYCLYALLDILDVYKAPFYQYATLVTIALYFVIAEFTSAFNSGRLENYGDIAGKVLFAWVLTGVALIFLNLITKSSLEFSRLAIISWLTITPIFLIIGRIFIFFILRRLRSQLANIRTYAILGNGAFKHNLSQQIEQVPWTGLKLVGTYQDLNLLLSDLERQSIDYVFLCYSSNEQEKIAAAIKALADSTASTYLVPDLLLSELLGSRWIMLGNTPLVVINDHPFYGGAWALKKIEDLVLGSVLLVLSLPLMLIIALAIRMNSPGPIFFRQRRHGLNGEVIKVLKFRTMRTQEDGSIVVQATCDDERVTSVGKFLRSTSLDELPQFFNVLEGSMSIVGPRPHALAHNDYYRELIDGYMQRHKVKPGITGWAQVNGFRGETDTIDKMQARVDYDLYYINHLSVGLDLKILLLTIIEVVNGKKAY